MTTRIPALPHAEHDGPLAGPRSAAAAVAVLGLVSVAPLLGWVYRLAPFHRLFAWVAVPGVLALVAICAWLAINRPGSPLLAAVRVGAVAGLVGTAGYDLFRVPFVAAGQLRLLSPIDSYGVLLLDAGASTGLTDFAGWSYHVTNGVLFGVAYAAIAWRRPWVWGLVWAFVLETATVVTPFADAYHLRGQSVVVLIAYAAHVPYGLALGLLVERGDRVVAVLDRHRWAVTKALATTGLGLALWLQPWMTTPTSATVDVTVVRTRFVPQFVRVPAGSCVAVGNADADAYTLATPDGEVALEASGTMHLCLDPGVHRIRTTGAPFDGGFVIVDPTVGRDDP